jgi:hypothetical protein
VETYVNHPSVFSGYLPNRHGIIANMYYNRPGTSRVAHFLGSEVDSIEANDGAGNLICVPTLGSRLGEAGLTARIIGSNSQGSTRLKHHRAALYPGHLNLPIRDVGLTVPPSEIPAWRARHGDGYALNFPDLAGSRAVVDSFFQAELPRGLAELTVLWIGEPDHSCHIDGPTGPLTLAALAQADELFGRILGWWSECGDEVQLVVVSDHGHVIADGRSHLREALQSGGLRLLELCDHAQSPAPVLSQGGANPADAEIAQAAKVGAGLQVGLIQAVRIQADRIQTDRIQAALAEADLVIAGLYCVGLWSARPRDFQTLRKAAALLMDSPDLGMLFTSLQEEPAFANDGIFPERLVLSDHPRAPDLRFVARGDPDQGMTLTEPGPPLGGGVHGGLLPNESRCLCAWGGSLFKRETIVDLPSGPCDIAATILRLLGFGDSALDELDGRVLEECLRGGDRSDADQPVASLHQTRKGGFKQILQRTVYKNRVYLDRGFRDI